MEDISAILRSHGHRVTRPRLAVWEALRGASRHLTADELAERAQRREPGLNLASVYRSLSLFEELDLVRASQLGEEEASRWELAHPDDHFHLVCDECGRVEHHSGGFVEEVREHLRDSHGFIPRAVDLTVQGTCRRCGGEGD